MNYFASRSAAERYAAGRPNFHPLAIEKIAATCGRIEEALDVACGTGLSTVALAEIAGRVVGTVVSPDMLSFAPAHPRITYVEGPAENLPLASASFDLITVCQALHWFDRERFLAEARRLLRPRGWLVIYNDSPKAIMVGNHAYTTWNDEQYTRRYPTPPRNSPSLTAEEVGQHGYRPEGRKQFIHDLTFTVEDWTRYLVTQSDVIAAVEAGNEDVNAVAEWITGCLRPLFRSEREAFLFECTIDFFRLEG